MTSKPDYSDRINVELGRVPHTYRELRSPIAICWEWESSGNLHQLVWDREPTPMTYGVRVDGRWTHMVNRDPKASGITTIKAAREYAEYFVNGHMLPEHDSAYE